MLYGEMPDIDGVKGFRFSVPSPEKSAILRVPTAEEMRDYGEQWRTHGERKSSLDARGGTPNYRPDLDLFKKVKVAGDDFDQFEARIAILKLIDASVSECKRNGARFRVALKTPFCTTVHYLKIPTAKQLLTSVNSGQRGAALYEEVIDRTEGYAPGVDAPEHHKSIVGAELVLALDSTYEGALEVNPPSGSIGTSSESAG